MEKSVLIPISHGSEELEFITLLNIFRRGNIKVILYGINEVITCARKSNIIPDINTLESINIIDLDAIIIPGGVIGVENLSKDYDFINLLTEFYKSNKIIGAICAAPQLLVEHNLISKNTSLTSHPSIKHKLTEYDYKEDNVVICDNLITSRGAGTSLEFSFSILELLTNKELVLKIKQDICYKGL